MKNLIISDLDKKSTDEFTSNFGLQFRNKFNNSFRKILSIFDNTNIIFVKNNNNQTDEEYFSNLSTKFIPIEKYDLKKGKHNIIVERYPKLDDNEQYIFVCNHTCPEDIETVLGVIDRNAHLVLGSIDSLQNNPEIFLLWLLNGIIPFDILDKDERKELIPKMKRVLTKDSILIFPEGSHNISPNKIINNLFDGPVNLATQTNKKIVLVSYLRDNENNASYIDFSNPIDVSKIDAPVNKYFPGKLKNEKYEIKSKTNYLRDKMATSVYYLFERHFPQIKRSEHIDLEEELREKIVADSFTKLKWKEGVDFEAEYLTKKTNEDRKYADVIKTISDLELNPEYLKKHKLQDNSFILKRIDLDRKNVPNYMEKYLKEKVLIKKR